jgi:hypothetical protein
VPAELAPRDSNGKPEASFRAYALGDMEAEYAETLIWNISEWRLDSPDMSIGEARSSFHMP